MNTIDYPNNPKLLWTSRETAAAMGISERTLWKLTNDGDIPCVRIGRAVRYDPTDIRSWIQTQKAANPSSATVPETT
jgi:excisionase family DNA binding protein